MTIRSEIRAALVDGPKTTDELLPLVVRRTGLDDNKRPLYAPDNWPAEGRRVPAKTESTGTASAPAKASRKRAAKAVAKRAPKKRIARVKAPRKAPQKNSATVAAFTTTLHRAFRVRTSTANATQVGGSHYKQLDPQPWDVISAWRLDFLLGNVVKYVARAPAKNGTEDLLKARHYLDKAIERAGVTA